LPRACSALIGGTDPAAMAPKRRFVPRTLCECRKALGELETPALILAFDDCLPEGSDAKKGSVGEDDADEPTGYAGLFRLLSKPKRGDWLDEHEELGQSFPQYAKRMAPKSGGVLPRYCAAFFPGMAVEVLDKPLSLKGVESRENDFGHKQYIIGDIFTMLNTHKEVISRRRAYCRLAITFEDIYPGAEWSYVFGQARPLDRVGVFSFARHSPLFYSGIHATEAMGQLETKKLLSWMRGCRHTVVHETCHMLGILHCVYWHCLMNGNNGPGDQNGSSAFLCPVCLRKLLLAMSNLTGGTNLEVMYGRYVAMQASLRELADEAGEEAPSSLHRDLAWLDLRRCQLRGMPPDWPPTPETAV